MSDTTGRALAGAEIAGSAVLLGAAARFSFKILIVLIPFRARIVLRPVEIGPIYSDYTDILLYASDVFALLTLALWAGALASEKRKPAAGPWFITWPLIGILGAGIVSSLDSVAPIISWHNLVRMSVLFALYLYAVNEVNSLEDLVPAAAAMIAVQSVVAIAQFLAQRSLGLQFLGELPLDPAMSGMSIVWAPGLLALRGYGLTDHPNLLGGCLALGLTLLIAAYPGVSTERRIPLFGVIMLGLIGLLFSFSRSAWLALAAGGLIVWLRVWRSDREHAGSIFVLGITSVLVLLPFLLPAAPFLGSRLGIGREIRIADQALLSPENRSLAERASLHAVANRMFVDDPLSGVGLGAFTVALQDRVPDFEFDYQPVHFVLLLAAAETGLLGALFYFLAASFPWVGLWLARAEPGNDTGLTAASAVLAGVTVIGLFDYYPWFLAPGRLWHWIIWGAWAAFYMRRRIHHV